MPHNLLASTGLGLGEVHLPLSPEQLLESIRTAPERLRRLDAIEDFDEWERALLYGLP